MSHEPYRWPLAQSSRARIGALVASIVDLEPDPHPVSDGSVPEGPALLPSAVRSTVIESLHAGREAPDAATLFNEAIRRTVEEMGR